MTDEQELNTWQRVARFNFETALLSHRHCAEATEIASRLAKALERVLTSEVVKNAQFVTYSEAIADAQTLLTEIKRRGGLGIPKEGMAEVELTIKKAEALDIIASGILPNGDHVEGEAWDYANRVKDGHT